MIKPREKELGIYFEEEFDAASRLAVEIAQREKYKE
jgi:hypothetical protein